MTRIVDIFDSYLNMSAKDKDQVTRYFSGINTDALTLRKQSSSVGSGAGYSDGNVAISFADGVTLYNPSTGARTIYLDPDGDAWFGKNIDVPADTALAIFANDNLYNSEGFGAGDLLIGDNSASKANLFWDRSTGKLNLRSGVTPGIVLSTDGTLQSGNYVTDAAGWNIDPNGDAEFNSIYARGAFRASVFTYENITAVGGGILVSKAASVVQADVTTASPFTLLVEPADDGTTSLFAVNDVIRIKGWNATEIIDIWGTVTASATAGGITTLTDVTLQSGGTGKAIQKGMAVVNYGPANAGIIDLQAGATSTRMRIATHAGSPWTTLTNRVVLGNMRGTYDTGANDRYGVGIGDFSSGNYLSYNAETANAFKVKAGGGVLSIDASGIRIAVSAANEGIRSYQFTDSSGNLIIALGGWQTGGQTKSALIVSGDATFPAALMSIVSQPDTGGLAQLALRAGNSYINLDHSGAGATSMTFFGDDYRFIEETVGGGQFTVEGAVTLGNSVPQHSVAGDTWVMNDQRIGGGLYVGSTGTDPDADNITADGDIHAGADLSATGDIRTVAWTDYSATSTITGWTTYTNKQIWYKKIGKLMHVQFAVQGVSNATSTSFTLPYANNANVRSYGVHRIYNNNVAAIGIHQMVESSNIASFYITPAAGSWTASGNKYIIGHFVYQTT